MEVKNRKLTSAVICRYFPVVAVVMFWPYAVSPLFDKAYGI
jgi:hypothetical protein